MLFIHLISPGTQSRIGNSNKAILFYLNRKRMLRFRFAQNTSCGEKRFKLLDGFYYNTPAEKRRGFFAWNSAARRMRAHAGPGTSRRLLAAAAGRISSAWGGSTRRSLPQTANASEPNSSRPSGRLIPSNARQRAKALSPIFCGVSGRSAQAGF